MNTELRDLLGSIIEGMSGPDSANAKVLTQLWGYYWSRALDDVRRLNDHELLHAMLATGHPVPAEIARQLMDLKGPRNRPPVIRETPEEVVQLVRFAISDGYPFPTPDGSAGPHSAFDEVAEQLGCSVSTVERYYKACPRAVRDEIKENEKALQHLLRNPESAHALEEPEKARPNPVLRFEDK